MPEPSERSLSAARYLVNTGTPTVHRIALVLDTAREEGRREGVTAGMLKVQREMASGDVQAYRDGAEEMRERAAVVAEKANTDVNGNVKTHGVLLALAIRGLPLAPEADDWEAVKREPCRDPAECAVVEHQAREEPEGRTAGTAVSTPAPSPSGGDAAPPPAPPPLRSRRDPWRSEPEYVDRASAYQEWLEAQGKTPSEASERAWIETWHSDACPGCPDCTGGDA